MQDGLPKGGNISRTSEVAAPLIEFLRNIYPLGEEIEKYMLANCSAVKLNRGDFLLKPGDICNHYYFIQKGMLRAFIRFGKKEITTWLNPENELVTSIRSMTQQQPSLEYIQALEDCRLIALPYDALQYLYQTYPAMNVLGRIVLQEYYAQAEERAFISRIPNAGMRYKHFIDSRQDLVNRVPLKYVASFLGMTEETLSRLRGKKIL